MIHLVLVDLFFEVDFLLLHLPEFVLEEDYFGLELLVELGD